MSTSLKILAIDHLLLLRTALFVRSQVYTAYFGIPIASEHLLQRTKQIRGSKYSVTANWRL